ncbi:helix-turn-helix domain-containing protein [Nocardia sp. CNY236]|uniref:helix-turn-helix domain-containing protein n=1 Tax=Nocardia sp. CNY236 TaxID=1169152 RepID=UPI0003F58526|nr:helix-turn-helix domain-containing protein [Nocardia sp. CNY236]
MEPDRTGRTLRRLRTERGISLRELAGQTFCDYSQLANIEAGRRWPKDRGWAERVDRVLDGRGALIAAWDADQAEHARRNDTMRMVDRARRESEALLATPDVAALDDIQEGIVEIAQNARFESYDRTLGRAMDIRAELMRRLTLGAHRPDEIRQLWIALGRVCGVLSYVTLDLGQADTALTHARASFHLGERAEHDQLRAWARGTQALAFRFGKDFEHARDAATDGLRYATRSTGTAESRLLCGLAASVANLGDSARAVELLDRAERARDAARPDSIPGLFTFTSAKQTYYRGFSLMWAEDAKTLRKSVQASEEAIAAWRRQRSPGDEMLSHIYLASASARLGDVDRSIAAVMPVLANPISAHFSWVRMRLTQLEGLLAEHFPDSAVAKDMRETLVSSIRSA